MRSISEYERTFSHISVGLALDLLNDLQVSDDRILAYHPGEEKITITTAPEYCAKINPAYLASSVGPIQFLGGPPGRENWTDGTLLTFVMDKVMYRDAMRAAS